MRICSRIRDIATAARQHRRVHGFSGTDSLLTQAASDTPCQGTKCFVSSSAAPRINSLYLIHKKWTRWIQSHQLTSQLGSPVTYITDGTSKGVKLSILNTFFFLPIPPNICSPNVQEKKHLPAACRVTSVILLSKRQKNCFLHYPKACHSPVQQDSSYLTLSIFQMYWLIISNVRKDTEAKSWYISCMFA